MALDDLPRRVIVLCIALELLEHSGWAGATYRGLRAVLGVRTDSGVRQAVRAARAAGVVQVLHTPDGRGARAIVRLSPPARTTLQQAGISPRKVNG